MMMIAMMIMISHHIQMITMMIARETEVDIYTWSHNCVRGCRFRLQWEQRFHHQVSRMHDPHGVRDQTLIQRTLPLINLFTFKDNINLGWFQQWALLHWSLRPAGQLSQKQRSVSTPCDIVSPHWDWVLYIMIMIMGGTSYWRSESSWCCLPPKRGRSQSENHHWTLRRRPSSPQTGGRGCGHTLVEEDPGWSSWQRVGTVRHWGGCRHRSRRPRLALMQVFIAGILIVTNQTMKTDILSIYSKLT